MNEGAQLNPGYCWLPVNGEELFTFSRRDTVITSLVTWYSLFVLMAAAVLAVFAKLVYDHTNSVIGELAFYYPGGSQPFYTMKLNQSAKRKVQHKLGESKDPKLKLNPLLRFIDYLEAKMEGEDLWVQFTGRELQGEYQNPTRMEPTPKDDETPAGDLLKQPRGEYRLPHAIFVRFFHPKYASKPGIEITGQADVQAEAIDLPDD